MNCGDALTMEETDDHTLIRFALFPTFEHDVQGVLVAPNYPIKVSLSPQDCHRTQLSVQEVCFCGIETSTDRTQIVKSRPVRKGPIDLTQKATSSQRFLVTGMSRPNIWRLWTLWPKCEILIEIGCTKVLQNCFEKNSLDAPRSSARVSLVARSQADGRPVKCCRAVGRPRCCEGSKPKTMQMMLRSLRSSANCLSSLMSPHPVEIERLLCSSDARVPLQTLQNKTKRRAETLLHTLEGFRVNSHCHGTKRTRMLRIKSVWSLGSQFITDHLQKKKKKILKVGLTQDPLWPKWA